MRGRGDERHDAHERGGRDEQHDVDGMRTRAGDGDEENDAGAIQGGCLRRTLRATSSSDVQDLLPERVTTFSPSGLKLATRLLKGKRTQKSGHGYEGPRPRAACQRTPPPACCPASCACFPSPRACCSAPPHALAAPPRPARLLPRPAHLSPRPAPRAYVNRAYPGL